MIDPPIRFERNVEKFFNQGPDYSTSFISHGILYAISFPIQKEQQKMN
jgi:hypothetical protein